MNRSLKRSIIWKICKEELQMIINQSKSMGEVLNKLGIQSNNGNNRNTLNLRIKEDLIDTSELEKNRSSEHKHLLSRLKNKNSMKYEDVFCEFLYLFSIRSYSYYTLFFIETVDTPRPIF